MREKILSFVLYLIFRTLRATWRLDEDALPPAIQERLRNGRAVIFAHLHEDEWAMLGFYAYREMSVLVSHSKDGSIMSGFLRRLGYRIARGSSSRGAVGGLKALIRHVQESRTRSVSLAVDGPRGPRRECKAGVTLLAKEVEGPVVMGAAFADRAWIFSRSWSRAFVPKPFARVRLVYGKPLEMAALAKRESACREIERRILDAKALARAELQPNVK